MGRTEIAALVVNCVNGSPATVSIAISMSPPMTASLVVILAILFSPLVGFAVSSVYTLIEVTVGNRFGSKGSFNDLYRLFSWSFLSLGLAALVSRFILGQCNRLGSFATPLATLIIDYVNGGKLMHCCFSTPATRSISELQGTQSATPPFVGITGHVAASDLLCRRT